MFNVGIKKTSLTVEGMTCHNCEMTVEKAVLEVPGVKSVKADHDSGKVEVQYIGELDLSIVKRKIQSSGYKTT